MAPTRAVVVVAVVVVVDAVGGVGVVSGRRRGIWAQFSSARTSGVHMHSTHSAGCIRSCPDPEWSAMRCTEAIQGRGRAT